MAFQDAMRNLQKYILDFTLDNKNIAGLLAVRAAADRNPYISATDNGQNGKQRDLNMVIIPPTCEDEAEEIGSVCSGGTAIPPQKLTFRLQRFTASDVLLLKKDDIRMIDQDVTFSDYAKSMILSKLHSVRDKLHTQVLTTIIGQVGLIPLPDGTGVTSLQVQPPSDPTTGAINPLGMDRMEQAYVDSGYDSPVFIGGTSIFNWRKARGRATDNNTIGQNFNQLPSGENMFYDPKVGQIFADATKDHIIAFSPRMLKFMTFSNNAGIFATDLSNVDALDAMYQRGGTDYIEGSLVDPRTGIIWDFDAKFDFCDETNGKVWRFMWYLLWDIYFMPPPVCNIQGVNSIFHFTTCLPAAVDCPTPESLSPVEATTYEFDTNGEISYPYFIQTLKQGVFEKDFEGLNQVDTIAELATVLNDFLAPYGIVLTVDGTKLTYEGHAPITLVINGADGLEFEFTEAA